MIKMSKFGLVTTSALLSLALLTSCSNNSSSSTGSTGTTSTPSTSTPSLDPTITTPPLTDTTDDGAVDLGLDDLMENEDTEEDVSPEDVELSDDPATPPEGESPVSPPELSSTQFNLNGTDDVFPLTVSGGVELKSITYKSSNEGVATVDKSGLVKAVSTGTATITVSFSNDGNNESLTATVRCVVEEEKPEETPDTEPETTPEPETPDVTPEPDIPEVTPEPEPEAPSSSVNLSSFYNSMSSTHSFGMMEPVTGDFLSNFFPGMSNISTTQQEIYMAMMTASAVEIALVEVANSSDVNTVKTIFQTRINTQAEGGAWYPEAMDAWKNNSRVVSNGNFVMMIVHPNCDAITSGFNALF